MGELPSLMAWKSLAKMIDGQLNHRPAGWLHNAKTTVEGTYQGCRVRAWTVGLDAPARLEMDGRGGRGLNMTFRNAMHTGGDPLTGDRAFDDDVDWQVNHRGYANLWLGRDVRRALGLAEYWDVQFDEGAVSALGRRGSFGVVLEAMSQLALRGEELGERWDRLAEELGGSRQRGPLSLRGDTIELLEGDVHLTITPRASDQHALSTLVRAKAAHSSAQLAPADLSEGELVAVGPGRATARLEGFVEDARRLRGVVDAMVRGLRPANPYR